VIYTLTDGFPDQFGGANGKKFMSKKLKELLIANVNLPISEQKELLETTFKNWVGDLEQVDDVCIIGIKI
jgi:serine phosphatase RsbU (regulator of sigma subunit)